MSLMVDYISMPPKSQEVSQVQSTEHAKLEQGEQSTVLEMQQQVQQQHDTTIRRNKAENQELRNEERKNGRNQKRKKNTSQKKKDSEKEAKSKEPIQSGGFDMRI